jgi:hypothetical protein
LQDYGESEGDSDEEEEQPGTKRARKSASDGPDRKEKHKVVEQKRREKVIWTV